MINYRLKIDFCDDKVLTSDISFVSGDVKSTTLNFEFYNEGQRVDISDYILSVRAKRSDGVVIASGGKIKENTAVFTPESNMYAVPGELYMEIALADSSGKYATTKVIITEVIEGLGEAATEGADNLNVYVNLLKDAISAKETAENAANAAKMVHPEIIDGVWWVYDADSGEMVSSGINATGEIPDSIARVEDVNELYNRYTKTEPNIVCVHTPSTDLTEDENYAGFDYELSKELDIYALGIYINGEKYTGEFTIMSDGSFDFQTEVNGSIVSFSYDGFKTIHFYPVTTKDTQIEIREESILKLKEQYIPNSVASIEYVDRTIGDIDAVADSVIALQESFMGGAE